MMVARGLAGSLLRDGDVIEVSTSGAGRIVSAADRVAAALADVHARAAVPAACGPDIQPAPARGPMIEFMPREVVETSAGGRVVRNAGYMGRRGARVADAFDLMTLQAQRQHPRAVKAAELAHRAAAIKAAADGYRARDFVEPAFVPPFTAGQVQMARTYAALSERVACSGVKCSSLEAVSQSSGGGGDCEVAMLRDFDALRVMHLRIGHGLAKEVRHIRPNGIKRSAIYVRRLVDMVCLGGASVQDVLQAHGWAVSGASVNGLRLALCGALERMQGYDLTGSQKRG